MPPCSKPRMNDSPDELGGRWHSGVVLKRDVFSTIERGRFRTEAGEVEAVLRRLDGVPWWSRILAHALFRRERRALAIAGPLGIAPPLLFAGQERPGARLDRRRAAAHRQAARRCGLFPLRQGGLAETASRRHRPQRSRQGTELALRRDADMAAHSSPTSSSPPASAAAMRCSGSPATKTCGISSSTSAATPPKRSPQPNGKCWRERASSPALGWRRERSSTTPSRAA